MQHEAIHGTIKARDIDYMSQHITEGEVYQITNFNVIPNKPRYKIIPHTTMLQFARAISFAPITTLITDIPMHRFYFVDFDQLPSRTDVHDILSGIINYNIISSLILIDNYLNFSVLISFPLHQMLYGC